MRFGISPTLSTIRMWPLPNVTFNVPQPIADWMVAEGKALVTAEIPPDPVPTNKQAGVIYFKSLIRGPWQRHKERLANEAVNTTDRIAKETAANTSKFAEAEVRVAARNTARTEAEAEVDSVA